MESPPTVPRRIIQMGATAEAARSTLVQAWRRLNPEYDHVFLTDAEGGDFVRAIASTAERAAYGALATGAQRSDLLRLLWLRELGGIYADSDTEPTLPLRVFVPRRATCGLPPTAPSSPTQHPHSHRHTSPITHHHAVSA